MNLSEKIALGTVQFGLKYGINNTTGEVAQEEVNRILNYAYENGIRTLDTATAYGNSETKLGNYLKANISRAFSIVTKFPPKTEVNGMPLKQSLEMLGAPQVYGYMAHDFKMFEGDLIKIKEFLSIKDSGLVKKTGFSLYYPSEVKFLIDNNIKFDIVQVPYSVFDQRFATVFEKLKDLGVEIHTRSSFLQGLVFKTPASLPEKLKGMSEKLKALIDLSHENKFSIQALCLKFCLAEKHIDKVVLGVDSLDNLRENMEAIAQNIPGAVLEKLKFLREENEKLILPLNW